MRALAHMITVQADTNQDLSQRSQLTPPPPFHNYAWIAPLAQLSSICRLMLPVCLCVWCIYQPPPPSSPSCSLF